MALIEVGRVCVKKFGRDAGKRAVITKVIDKSFVNIISSGRLMERKCNIKHLELLAEKIDAGSKEQLARVLEIDQSKLDRPKAVPSAAKAAPRKKT